MMVNLLSPQGSSAQKFREYRRRPERLDAAGRHPLAGT